MAKKSRGRSLTARMIERGFDLSRPVPFERGVKIGCSQCEAASINGVPCHERGCPNQKGECAECGAIVDHWNRLCDDCMADSDPGGFGDCGDCPTCGSLSPWRCGCEEDSR